MSEEARANRFLSDLEDLMEKYDVSISGAELFDLNRWPTGELLVAFQVRGTDTVIAGTKLDLPTTTCTRTSQCGRHSGHTGDCRWRLG